MTELIPADGSGPAPVDMARLFANGSPSSVAAPAQAAEPAQAGPEAESVPRAFGDIPVAWERLPDETAKAFAMFQVYRDLGPDRTVKKVAEKAQRGNSQLLEWCRVHSWVRRAAAYDAYLDGRARQTVEELRQEELETFRKRQLKLAAVKSNLGVRVLGKIARSLDNMDAQPERRDASGEVIQEARAEQFIEPDKMPNWIRAVVFLSTSASSIEAQALSLDSIFSALGVTRSPSSSGPPPSAQAPPGDTLPSPADMASGA